jgi:hypothetical protein
VASAKLIEIGSVSLHFQDIKEVIQDIVIFIENKILKESTTFQVYIQKSQQGARYTPSYISYLATEISNGIFTRIGMSFFSEPITISELLKYCPSKYNMCVVVAFEGTDKSSDDSEGSGSRVSYRAQKNQRRAGTQEVARKRSCSMAIHKVIYFALF